MLTALQEDEVYHCNRYTRKTAGPFAGMLVDSGTPTTIGPTPYIKYSVLEEL